MACKIEHASVEYRNRWRPELIRFAKIDSSFLRPILSFTENLSAGRWGEARDTMMQFFPIEFLSPRIFSAETTIHRSPLPLPSPQQESTP